MPETPPAAGPGDSRVRRLAADWVPPALLRSVRRRAHRAARRAPGASSPARPRTGRERAPARKKAGDALPARWESLTSRMLEELETCEAVYRPTNFWGPGVQQLLDEMTTRGLASFKAWPAARFWFYPVYDLNLRRGQRRRLLGQAERIQPSLPRSLRPRLDGVASAQRDFDAARLAWDHARWPADLESHGESRVGRPRRLFRLAESDARWGKPYLNYLLCMAALSQHVTTPPKSFLELGGGFGVLGELVLARDPEARYVNCDLPPLLTVASFYLTELFGDDRVLTYDGRVPPTGPVDVTRSACLPNWRIGDLEGPFDVFVNSYSFQEMEPDVVRHYVDTVAALGVTYVVSLNSRKGKKVAEAAGDIGVLEQVTSGRIVEMFEERGYQRCGTYHRPLVTGAGEIAVLRKR